MVRTNLKICIDVETADAPPSGDPDTRHVSLMVDYRRLLRVVVPHHVTRMHYEAKSGLVSHPDFLAHAEARFVSALSVFYIDVNPHDIARLARNARVIIARHPNRRVVPLRLIVKSLIVLPSVAVIDRYMLAFATGLSVVTAADMTRVPADNSFVESLEYVSLREGTTGEEERCSICLEEFNGEDGDGRILQTPCLHFYHEPCIVQWLKTSHTCPLCRFEMPR